MPKKSKLSTDNYKGVRDFYPEDHQAQRYIYSKAEEVVEKFGYQEYNASPLEYHEIYKAKSGEEIAEEQTYTFEDRGGRIVSLRPEMTPTAARMVAKKSRELRFPVRWYSITNIFRYENPQKGRLREHYQLNADIFGGTSEEADMEMIFLVNEIMNNFGATPKDFTIYINDRRILQELFTNYEIEKSTGHQISKLLDKKDKMSESAFQEEMLRYLDPETTEDLLNDLSSSANILAKLDKNNLAMSRMMEILGKLQEVGVSNVSFEPTLVRGFDYYTGLVFEVTDTDPSNPRSLFGGGRYDSLVSHFSDRDIPAVGFGLGDVRLLEFLKIHSLLPQFTPTTDLVICRAGNYSYTERHALASSFRDQGIRTEVDISGKKLKDQISSVSKKCIPFVAVMGEKEEQKEKINIKHLPSGEERTLSLGDACVWIKKTLK
ncbi:MAG: histidine--tRNA ligase [Candidatus Paceibacterota bacterium]